MTLTQHKTCFCQIQTIISLPNPVKNHPADFLNTHSNMVLRNKTVLLLQLVYLLLRLQISKTSEETSQETFSRLLWCHYQFWFSPSSSASYCSFSKHFSKEPSHVQIPKQNLVSNSSDSPPLINQPDKADTSNPKIDSFKCDSWPIQPAASPRISTSLTQVKKLDKNNYPKISDD
jgi:hypothetical protein